MFKNKKNALFLRELLIFMDKYNFSNALKKRFYDKISDDVTIEVSEELIEFLNEKADGSQDKKGDTRYNIDRR